MTTLLESAPSMLDFSTADAITRRFFDPLIETKIRNPGEALNSLGDRYLVAGKWGADISIQRPDDLDQTCFHFAAHSSLNGRRIRFLDVGGAIGAQTFRLALTGAGGVLIDIQDQGQAKNIENFFPDNPNPPVTFVHGDIQEALKDNSAIAGQKFDIFYSQRMWSSIPYANAQRVLRHAVSSDLFSENAAFFVSAIGLHSEIGRSYPHRKKRPSQRWSLYSPEMARKHGVTGYECLYSRKNLVQQFEKAGLDVIFSWTSSFGNPKVIAVHPSASAHVRHVVKGFAKAVRAEKR